MRRTRTAGTRSAGSTLLVPLAPQLLELRDPRRLPFLTNGGQRKAMDTTAMRRVADAEGAQPPGAAGQPAGEGFRLARHPFPGASDIGIFFEALAQIAREEVEHVEAARSFLAPFTVAELQERARALSATL